MSTTENQQEQMYNLEIAKATQKQLEIITQFQDRIFEQIEKSKTASYIDIGESNELIKNQSLSLLKLTQALEILRGMMLSSTIRSYIYDEEDDTEFFK